MFNIKDKQYWYVTEIKTCILCGHVKKNRYRVYEKPESNKIYSDYPCWCGLLSIVYTDF